MIFFSLNSNFIHLTGSDATSFEIAFNNLSRDKMIKATYILNDTIFKVFDSAYPGTLRSFPVIATNTAYQKMFTVGTNTIRNQPYGGTETTETVINWEIFV